MIIAIDVGGVLASKQHDGEPMPGSLETIAQLYAAGHQLWITSMCGAQREVDTIKWLDDTGFSQFIPRSRQLYVRFKAGDKNALLNMIGAEVFIDDRMKHIKPALLNARGLRLVFHLTSERPESNDARYIAVSHWYAIGATLSAFKGAA